MSTELNQLTLLPGYIMEAAPKVGDTYRQVLCAGRRHGGSDLHNSPSEDIQLYTIEHGG